MTKILIDPGKTYRTRHGGVVRNVRYREGAVTEYTILADVCDLESGHWSGGMIYTSFGEYWAEEVDDLDLIEVESQETAS